MIIAIYLFCIEGRVFTSRHFIRTWFESFSFYQLMMLAWPRSAVGGASDSRARGPVLDTRSGHILSFLLPLIKKGRCQLLAKVFARSTPWLRWWLSLIWDKDKNQHKMLKIQQIFPKLYRCLLYVVFHHLESQNAGLVDVKRGLH